MDKEEKEARAKLGSRMRSLRIENGYSSLERFAFDHDMSRVLYSNYENGRGNPTYKTIRKIANIHQMTLEEFFKGF